MSAGFRTPQGVRSSADTAQLNFRTHPDAKLQPYCIYQQVDPSLELSVLPFFRIRSAKYRTSQLKSTKLEKKIRHLNVSIKLRGAAGVPCERRTRARSSTAQHSARTRGSTSVKPEAAFHDTTQVGPFGTIQRSAQHSESIDRLIP